MESILMIQKRSVQKKKKGSNRWKSWASHEEMMKSERKQARFMGMAFLLAIWAAITLIALIFMLVKDLFGYFFS